MLFCDYAAWWSSAVGKSDEIQEGVSRNAFVEVTPPPGQKVRWISEDDFVLVGQRCEGSEKVSIRARPGWKLTQPKDGVMTLAPGQTMAYAVTSALAEDGGGGTGHPCPAEKVVTNHISAPIIFLTNVTAKAAGIIVPSTGVTSTTVSLGATANVVSNGLHEIVTTIPACPKCERTETVTTNKTPIAVSSFVWEWYVGKKSGTKVGGSSFSTDVSETEPDDHPVFISAVATNVPDCCGWLDSALTNALVLRLDHKTAVTAAEDDNPRRTKLGVAEDVSLFIEPKSEKGTWSYEAPDLASITMEAQKIEIVAPYHAKGWPVKFEHKSGQSGTITFNVVNPSGYHAIPEAPPWYFGIGISGASLSFKTYLPPFDVSFTKVEIIEVCAISTDAVDYFADTDRFPDAESRWWTHGPAQGAGSWKDVVAENFIDYDLLRMSCPSPWHKSSSWYDPFGLFTGYSGGSLTWPIPAKWRVAGTVPDNPLHWSDQHFNLSGNGTLSITKFGYTVTRTTNDVITLSSQP